MSPERAAAEASGHETVGFRRRREKRARAEAFLAGNPLLIGLDIGKTEHAVWIAGRDLLPIRRFMAAHSHAGMALLLDRAQRDREARGFDRLVVFMEPTAPYWLNVAAVLDARGVPYRTISGLAVAREREIEHLTYAKGDYRDAELILRLGAAGQWLHCRLEHDPLWLRLHALAREHEVLLAAEIEERLRIRSFLHLALPELFSSFKDPLGDTAIALLKKVSRPAASIPETFTALHDRIADLLEKGIKRRKVRRLLAQLETAPSFGVERALAPSLGRIGLAVDRFELLHDQRVDVRSQLVALYQATPYQVLLDTIPSVVPENHALVLGFLGDPRQFDRATCLVKLAGTEPRENHSGLSEGIHSISHRGRSPLRHVLYRIIMGLQRGGSELNAYMARLRTRDKNPLAWHQAAVATANKYLRLVYHMCVRGKPYDASKLSTGTRT